VTENFEDNATTAGYAVIAVGMILVAIKAFTNLGTTIVAGVGELVAG